MNFIRFKQIRYDKDPFRALSELVYRLSLGSDGVVDSDALHQLGFGFRQGNNMDTLTAEINERWRVRAVVGDQYMCTDILKNALVSWVSEIVTQDDRDHTPRSAEGSSDHRATRDSKPETAGQSEATASVTPEQFAYGVYFRTPRLKHPSRSAAH